MRKFEVLFVGVVLSLALTACGSSTSTTNGSSNVPKPEVVAETDTSSETETPALAEQMKVDDYTCVIDDSFRYYVMFITNDSDKVVNVEANIVAKDEANTNVGAYEEGVGAIAPGQTSCIWTTFDEYDAIESFDYALTVEETGDGSIYNDVAIEYNTTDTKVVATATNSGTDPANFVWFDVVYLKDGKMVGFSEISLMDSDNQLAAGQSITGEGECYSETGFDSVVVALNGRK